MDAELVLQSDGSQVVTRAEAAVRVHHHLGYDEQRNAANTFRRIRRARKDHVDDIVGEILVAVADEYLLAADAIGAVPRRHGAGGERAHIGAGLGLCQVHRAGPFAGNHLLQKDVLLLIRTVIREQVHCALGKQRRQREGQAGRLPHLRERRGHEPRKALPAIFRVEGRAVPAALAELPVGFPEPVRRAHDAVFQHSSLHVADTVEGRHRLVRKPPRLGQHGIDEIDRNLLHAGQGDHSVQFGDLGHREANVAEGRGVIGHWRHTGRIVARLGNVAGRPGFEPGLLGPEPSVLPLNYRPTHRLKHIVHPAELCKGFQRSLQGNVTLVPNGIGQLSEGRGPAEYGG